MAKIIGIDLGTSNTAAAVMEGGRGTIIPSAEGSSIGGKAFPSYVAFTKDGQRLVGEPARRQAIANPEGTVTAFKRKMGENYKFNLRGQEFTPQQLSAFVLQKVKKDAEAFLGEPVEKAVITVVTDEKNGGAFCEELAKNICIRLIELDEGKNIISVAVDRCVFDKNIFAYKIKITFGLREIALKIGEG